MTAKTISPALVLKAGPVKLARLRREVTVDGREVHLSPTEFAVLEQLMLGQGAVLTVGDLVERVFKSPVTQISVTVYISKLRRSLGVKNLIYTVRGQGYIIDKEKA